MIGRPVRWSFAMLALAAPATAATFEVDRTDDDPAAFLCSPAPFDCSLRGAVIASNIGPGADTITIPAATYDLTVDGVDEAAAQTGDLDLTDDVVIEGAGRDLTTIQWSGGANDRIFEIFPGLDVEIRGVSLREGRDVNIGGGIRIIGSSTTVLLEDIELLSNTSDVRGGGVDCSSFNDLTIRDARFRLNRSTGSSAGGGLYSFNCDVTIENSEFISNRLTGTEGDGGAAILATGSSAVLTVSDSVFRINESDTRGGAIAVLGGTATLTDTVVAGNVAEAEGGGVYVDEGASLTVLRTTIHDNLATTGAGGGVQVLGSFTGTDSVLRCNQADFAGGGIGANDGTVTLTNSTVSQNASDAGAGINIVLGQLDLTNSTFAEQSGDELALLTTFTTVNAQNNLFGDLCAQSPAATIVSAGGNVELPGATCIDSPQGSDLFVADVGLGSLADHGGPTRTHLPRPTSPVVGAAVDGGCPGVDQRGLPRSDCDSGSVERQPSDPDPIFANDFECRGLDLWSAQSP